MKKISIYAIWQWCVSKVKFFKPKIKRRKFKNMKIGVVTASIVNFDTFIENSKIEEICPTEYFWISEKTGIPNVKFDLIYFLYDWFTMEKTTIRSVLKVKCVKIKR